MAYLTDAQIEAQYRDFEIVGFEYSKNRLSDGYSGIIEVKFPHADHPDFDDYKCDNYIVYDNECERIAFDNWYPVDVYNALCEYIRNQIINNKQED